MHRRVACIALSNVRVEVAEEVKVAGGPLVVVVARPGSTVKTERDVLGNTRIDFVSSEAGALGVRAGQTVAAARAKCAELRVRVIAEGAVFSALARVAEAVLAFGPTTGFDVAQDVVWVDVSGSEHLYGGGEVELARSIGARVRALGHACRVAVADGPRIASAVARFSKSGSESVVVPRGKGDRALRSLPLATLALDPEARSWLADLGVSTCGDLQRLPRRSLGARLGKRVHDVMKLLDGVDHEPLVPWRPPEVPEERVEFDWGVHSTEALSFAMKTLCDRLAGRLSGRALAAARLELVLSLDRAFCDGAFASPVVSSMALPSPIGAPADLLAVVRARLETCSLPAPVLAVTLRAPELARASARTLDLLVPESKAERALPRLVAELAAEVGDECVGILTLLDTWVCDKRTGLLSYGKESLRGADLVVSTLEPTRLVRPLSLSSTTLPEILAGAKHLARFEAVEWWGNNQSANQGCLRRDLYAAWVDGALGWLERFGVGNTLLRGWVD